MIIKDELFEYRVLFFEQAELRDNEVDSEREREGDGGILSFFLLLFFFTFLSSLSCSDFVVVVFYVSTCATKRA